MIGQETQQATPNQLSQVLPSIDKYLDAKKTKIT